MTRCYIDTNFLYLHLRQREDPDVRTWRERLEAELAGEPGVISPLVLDELAYRLGSTHQRLLHEYQRRLEIAASRIRHFDFRRSLNITAVRLQSGAQALAASGCTRPSARMVASGRTSSADADSDSCTTPESNTRFTGCQTTRPTDVSTAAR